ncbi:MAG: regulatory protein GemA [Desulfobacterales bacterium]|nr:regulatory protein GemA [Desulfobacterales bacterium]
MISNKKKAVIHIAKDQVGMTNQEYSDLLSSVGVESSVDLNNATFSKVMEHMKKLGFVSTSKSGSKRNIHNLPVGKRALMQKLEALIIDTDTSWGYVDAIAKKRFGKDRAQWLAPEDLRRLVIMMQYHSNRKKKRAAK